MSTGVLLTYDDYAALPGEGRRYELLDGQLRVTPAPSPRHQRVTLNLAVILDQHVKARRRGQVYVSPIDCILSNITVLQPDLVYIDADHLHIITDRGIDGPPTLVVEVLSPSSSDLDRRTKARLYARHGIPHHWIVDPETRRIEAYRGTDARYHLAGRVEGTEPGVLSPFPDLSLDPATIWA